MKKLSLLVLGSMSLLVACQNETPKGNTIIAGEIQGLKQGTLYVQQVKDSTLVVIDSMVLKGKSTFETSFDLEEPEVVYLSLNRGVSQSLDNLILFFAEPGKMLIKSSLDNFSGGAVIEGSANQELYNKYLEMRSAINNRHNELVKDHLLAQKNQQFSKADSLEQAISRTGSRFYLNALNFVLKNNKNEVAPYITLTDIATIHHKHLDTIYNNLDPKIAQSKYGLILENYMEMIKE